jgi:hypothetical protein
MQYWIHQDRKLLSVSVHLLSIFFPLFSFSFFDFFSILNNKFPNIFRVILLSLFTIVYFFSYHNVIHKLLVNILRYSQDKWKATFKYFLRLVILSIIFPLMLFAITGKFYLFSPFSALNINFFFWNNGIWFIYVSKYITILILFFITTYQLQWMLVYDEKE